MDYNVMANPFHVMAHPFHVMAGLDPAIALSLALMPVARSSRAMTAKKWPSMTTGLGATP